VGEGSVGGSRADGHRRGWVAALRGDGHHRGPCTVLRPQAGEPSSRQRAVRPSGVAGAGWHTTTLGERERAGEREEGRGRRAASVGPRTGGRRRRRRGAVALVAAASVENARERTGEMPVFWLKGEAEAEVYICFSRF